MREFIVVGSNIGQLVRGLGPRCRDVVRFISLNIVLNNANPLGIGQSKSNLSTDISLLGRAAIPNKKSERDFPLLRRKTDRQSGNSSPLGKTEHR